MQTTLTVVIGTDCKSARSSPSDLASYFDVDNSTDCKSAQSSPRYLVYVRAIWSASQRNQVRAIWSASPRDQVRAIWSASPRDLAASPRYRVLERFHLATQSHNRNKNFQFWQYGNNPKEVYSNKFMWSKLDYIHLNPVRAGLVEKASHYVYSSAGDYVEKKGLVPIETADNLIVEVMNLTI